MKKKEKKRKEKRRRGDRQQTKEIRKAKKRGKGVQWLGTRTNDNNEHNESI